MLLRYIFPCSLFFTSGFAYSQSTPSEFAEMSFQDLLNVNVSDNADSLEKRKWTLSLQFKAAEFDGYMIDDSDVSLDEVLFSPGEEPRTEENFPVVPTVINQYAKIVQIGYQVSSNIKLGIQIPLIRQETDHVSVVPGYDEFLISSEGLGDVVVTGHYEFASNENYSIWLSGGISFPSGSIDEEGDTPRAAGDQQLPYTMQLGSGTYDLPLEIGYQNKGQYPFSIMFSARVRTGENDRNYRLGNNYEINGKYNFITSQNTTLFAGAELSYADSIHGRDDDITVGGAFPYPAGITNPELYGGSKVRLFGGVNYLATDWLQLQLSASKPVYQNLNGPQPKELWRFGFQLSTLF
ncbi:hypothetical protein [Alteromonas sp. ALT199]|uniref:hypothetical protein n=1 Tax=unclassified Alteromonas TaxID=2614992 RepID=UPI0004453DFA|nr:hypothetical protein [Alteromonas sp. ALT199]